MAPDAPMGDVIPSPGDGDDVDQAFDSVEPNDTPAEATPLGVASGSDVYVWVDANQITPGHTSDYFVFETSGQAGVFGLSASGLCYSGGLPA